MLQLSHFPGFVIFLVALSLCHRNETEISERVEKSNRTNNWAVIIVTSRYWYNYHFIANGLSIYRNVKRLGIPDSQIILMLPDDMACNPRNPKPGTIFNKVVDSKLIDLYGDDVEVDYRGFEVTVENVFRLLTARVRPDTPRSKRLLTDEGSNILVYMSGHGAKDGIKFQEDEVLVPEKLAEAFEYMWQKKRYNEILFIVDTCEAAVLYKKIHSPNIIAVASSLEGEYSYPHDRDHSIGVRLILKYTYNILEFLENIEPISTRTMSEFLEICSDPSRSSCDIRTGVRKDLYKRDLNRVPITDFFGSVRPVIITTDPIDLLDLPLTRTKKTMNNTNFPVKSYYLPQFQPSNT